MAKHDELENKNNSTLTVKTVALAATKLSANSATLSKNYGITTAYNDTSLRVVRGTVDSVTDPAYDVLRLDDTGDIYCYGNVAMFDDDHRFIGNLQGTADYATRDGANNIIHESYLNYGQMCDILDDLIEHFTAST